MKNKRLSDLVEEGVRHAQEELGINIVSRNWIRHKDWKAEGEVVGMCPLSCAFWHCTGEFPPEHYVKNGREKYDTLGMLNHIILPALDACMDSNLPAGKLSYIIRSYDLGAINAQGMIERIREKETIDNEKAE